MKVSEIDQPVIPESLLSALQDVKVAEKKLNAIRHEPRLMTLSEQIAQRGSARVGLLVQTKNAYWPQPPPIPLKPQKNLYGQTRRKTMESLASFMTKVSEEDRPPSTRKLSDIEACLAVAIKKQEMSTAFSTASTSKHELDRKDDTL